MAEDNKDTEKKNENTAADLAARDDRRAGSTQDRIDASLDRQAEEREALTEPADIGAASATKMEASGAIIEDAAKKAVDVDHPAVDNNPRANTTERQNRIDFNDQTLTDRKAVEQNLDSQG